MKIASVQYRQYERHLIHAFLCCVAMKHQFTRISGKHPSTQISGMLQTIQESVQYRQTIRDFITMARQICLVCRPLACCQGCLPIGRSCSPLACQIQHTKHQKFIFLFRFHNAAKTCVRHYRNCGLCHIHAAARQMKVMRFIMLATCHAALPCVLVVLQT